MRNFELITQSKTIRKLVDKKYIDLSLSPKEASSTYRNFNSSRLQMSPKFLHKKIYPEDIELSKKRDKKSLAQSTEEAKSFIHLPAAQSSKTSLSSIKRKSIYFNSFKNESINKKPSERVSSSTTIRKGLQGYKFSILNSNRNLVKNRFTKQSR